MILSSIGDVDTLISKGARDDDIYGTNDVQLDCLLPTGIYIQLTVNRWNTVNQVKEKLWKDASYYPLYDLLKDKENYIFVYINSFGVRQEIVDEERQISTIQPFLSMLKVIKKEHRDPVKDLESEIGALIGKHNFESLRDEEIIAFRRDSQQLCERLNDEKASVRDLDQLISFMHPPDVCEDVDLWQRVQNALKEDDNKFFVEIHHTHHNGNNSTHRLHISADVYPEDVIHGALRKQSQASRHKFVYDTDEHVLKIVGREEYLLPDGDGKPRPLYKYTYIYRCIIKQEAAKLIVLKKSDVNKAVPRSPKVTPPPIAPRLNKTKKGLPNADLWTISDKFSFKVVGVNQLDVDECGVFLKAAIYHGVETLCDMKDTQEVTVSDKMVEFNERLEFDLAVCDLPRMSRLCFTLYAELHKPNKAQKKAGTLKSANKDYMPLAWVNLCLFDFKARLTVGHKTLHMWPYDETIIFSDNPTNHLGTVVSNPQNSTAVSLLLHFSHYGNRNRPIVYPPMDVILDCAAQKMSDERLHGCLGQVDTMMTEEDAGMYLRELLDNRDPLQAFHEQEKEQIWAMRLDVSTNYRESLPKLLSCVRWNCHSDVAQMQALLQSWPSVSVDTALELLDCMYPDKRVRNFAVTSLRQSISDTELCRYLLQLVQALKFESYLDCDLVYFLLERAIHNRKVGHYLFWMLKSEMHTASVSIRFGLILEAYCRGSVDHVAVLRTQDDTVSKLLAINRLVKSSAEKEPKPTVLKAMRQVLDSYKQSETFKVISSPLDPALRLSTLQIEKCRYMESKMKPLLLVWENGDKFGDEIQIIFKNGDDLRQDMLTLQILHIMDNIWLSQGLDLRLSPYSCLSSGRDVGMLEVVQEASTIANIQKSQATTHITAAFNKECLYRWLQSKNPNPAALQRAVKEFTFSCAGYCVASYVLGIGDRHSDNIMLKKTGQLFHIDFGHFLGNFKSKYGIRRERVPFVLANDFIYIIQRNTSVKDPFLQFRKLCEQAFLLLRKKGTLLISLFMMMLSTGLPELRSVSDLKYLQDTLKLDLPDDKALRHFRGKLKEAIKNSWTTSVNWTIHNLAKDNA
ncbi:phosphatidylinositol 4,5-bisphosphate 3-kinase catalytic subunit delta isoform-like isoform X2 [Watersipora subatra]|uniref:phosphatidylinositol 4,5-bisphosphate 3-kinase catalytic subunit delta isoform-like isoform X2 n=1 Tax=Watersipora subatra TaxID=2589382 RepID=UPI00355C55D2